ncbi:MAG: FAD-binding protein [Gammaproteobacteria bacterium]
MTTTRRALNFLFATVEGGGNIAPAMTVVRRLVDRGHRVRVLSDLATQAEASAAGAELVPWQRAPSRRDRSRQTEIIRDWAAATPQEGFRQVLELICGRAIDYARDTIAELEREPADLVVTFDMLIGVMTGCESVGQKLAVLSTSLSMYPMSGVPPFGPGLLPATNDADRELHAAIAAASMAMFDEGLPSLNGARGALGLNPLAHVYDQADYATVHWLGTARAFDFPAELPPPRVRYAGPLIGDPCWVAPWQSPWPAEDVRPLVLVAFSTTFQNHAACLQRVIDACGTLAARVLVTLGGAIHTHELAPAPNTVIVHSAPHDVVMRESSLVVTHGGHGTVITALVHGLPLLVIPHGRDQADNAARVTARGAGLSLQASASVDELRTAVQRLLEEPAFHSAARDLGEAVSAEARSSRLIEELEALAAVKSEPDAIEGSDAFDGARDRREALKGLLAAMVCAAVAAPRPTRATVAGKAKSVDISELRRSIAGEVVPLGSRSYVAARDAMTWNLRKSTRKPDAIVRVRSAREVCAAVRFAAAHGLKVAVRSGGHNYHNSPVRDGGLLLDLSALNGLSIDAPNLRASVQPAVKSGALVSALTPLGLAFPVGHCSDVPLGGFLLNGGVGWNGGGWGPACLSVRGVELVTASGDLVYADENHERDLFWAARGAGPGFFGVVTRYDLALQKLPKALATRGVVFDVDAIESAGDWLAELANAVPSGVEVVYLLGANAAPPAAGAPANALSVLLVAFADSESEAQRWLSPIDSHPAAAKVLASLPYETATLTSLQALNDADFPDGCRMAGDQCWSNSTPRQILSAVREAAVSAPSNRSFVFLSPNAIRGDLNSTAAEASFSMSASMFFGAYAFWNEAQRDAANLAWLQSAMRAVEPLATGHYVGEADLSVDPRRASRCFSAAAWQKLASLKKRYDPADVFFSYLTHA